MRIIFPTDEHIPYQDKRACELAMLICQDFDPDIRIAGSDALDFYALSNFDKNPERLKTSLQEEIDQWVKQQIAWKSASRNAKVKYIPGNHEERLKRFLFQHPEIESLTSLRMENLLKFDDLAIEWNEGIWTNMEISFGPLVVKHGRYIRQKGGGSAIAELDYERYAISTVTGHTHRGGSTFAKTRDGIVQAHECFCLCDLNPEYVCRPNWQQGVTLVEIVNERANVELVPFHDVLGKKVARWRGREYGA